MLRRPSVLLLSAAAASCAWVAPASATTWVAGPSLTAAEFTGPPGVAIDEAGRSMIVWPGPGGAVMTRPITANGTADADRALGPGSLPAVTGTPGGAVIGFGSENDLQLGRLTASGGLSGLDVAAPDAGALVAHRAVALPDGGLMVTWADISGDHATGFTLYARRFSFTGGSGPTVALGTARPDDLLTPASLAATPDGRVRVAWSSPVPGSPRNAIRVARISPTGTVEATTTVSGADATANPQVAAAHSGSTDAVVTWDEGAGNDLTTRRLRAARLPSSGGVSGPAATVADGLRSLLPATGVAASPNGYATIAYGRRTAGIVSGTLSVRRMSIDGQLGPDTALAGPTTATVGVLPNMPVEPMAPALTAGRGNSVLAVWPVGNIAPEPGPGNEDWAYINRFESRLIAADGSPDPTAFAVPNGTPGLRIDRPTLTGNGNGRGILSWIEGTEAGVPTHRTATFDATTVDINAAIPAAAVRGVAVSFAVEVADPSNVERIAWQFGNGDRSSSAAPTVTYARAGSYPVSVAVTAKNGTTATQSGTIVVSDPAVQAPPGSTPPPSSPTSPGTPKAVRTAARLQLTKAARTRKAITAAGTIGRAASGRVTVIWSQKVGRKTVKRSSTARIAKGRFAATIKLRGSLARARTRGRLVVHYRGDADTVPATVSRTLKAPKR